MSLGRKLQICKFGIFLKLEIFNPILKFTYLTASSSRFGVLAKAMQCADKCFGLPDANGKNSVCGNLYYLSLAYLKDFAVKLWSELKILLSECCFAVAWSS